MVANLYFRLTKQTKSSNKTQFHIISPKKKCLFVQIYGLNIVGDDVTGTRVQDPQRTLHLLHAVELAPVGVRPSVGGAHGGVQPGAEAPRTLLLFGENRRHGDGGQKHNEPRSHLSSCVVTHQRFTLFVRLISRYRGFIRTGRCASDFLFSSR